MTPTRLLALAAAAGWSLAGWHLDTTTSPPQLRG